MGTFEGLKWFAENNGYMRWKNDALYVHVGEFYTAFRISDNLRMDQLVLSFEALKLAVEGKQ